MESILTWIRKNRTIQPILSIILITLLIYQLTSSVEARENQLEKRIGEKVVIDNDTLTVVSYQLWSGDFILSNGVKVSESIIQPPKH